MNRKAQQVIEYLLLIASVLLVFLAVAGPHGFIRVRMEDSINQTLNLIKKDDPAGSSVYSWSAANCDCSGQRSCVYPGGDEVFVTCSYECINNLTHAPVNDWFCLDSLGYKPSSETGCGDVPCCGNGVFDLAYGEFCDASAGFTETCESRFGVRLYGWSGSVRCTNDCKVTDDCVENPPPPPDVCGDNQLTGSEACDEVAGVDIFAPGVPGHCTDYMVSGHFFEGGVLGCDTSADPCKVDTGDCYRCGAWGAGTCGTRTGASRANPTSPAHCSKDGTEFISRNCTRGDGTTFLQGQCRANPACGNQCGIKEDYSTPCPGSSTYSYEHDWQYVDDLANCTSEDCVAYCNGDLVVRSGSCRCPKNNFVFNTETEKCFCPSPFVIVTGNCQLCGNRTCESSPPANETCENCPGDCGECDIPDVYGAWQAVPSDVYGSWSGNREVTGSCIANYRIPTDTCSVVASGDQLREFTCRRDDCIDLWGRITQFTPHCDNSNTCTDVLLWDTGRIQSRYRTRSVECYNPETYNPDRYGSWSSWTTIDGSCFDIPYRDRETCDYAFEEYPYTCESFENNKRCNDVECENFGRVNYCTYKERDIRCFNGGEDTCDNNSLASYTCPDGVTKPACRDVNLNQGMGGSYRTVTCN